MGNWLDASQAMNDMMDAQSSAPSQKHTYITCDTASVLSQDLRPSAAWIW